MKIILAVILGEAIWGLLVSLTNGLIVPGLARVTAGDPQSPVYLGNGSFQLTQIFVSVLELCLAGIVAILLNQWSRSGPAGRRVRTIKVRTVAANTILPSIAPSSIAPPPMSVPAAPEPPPVAIAAAVAAQPAPLPASSAPVPSPQATPPAPKPVAPIAKPAAPSKPEKPKKPAEVYYNLVGEPINPTEDDE